MFQFSINTESMYPDEKECDIIHKISELPYHIPDSYKSFLRKYKHLWTESGFFLYVNIGNHRMCCNSLTLSDNFVESQYFCDNSHFIVIGQDLEESLYIMNIGEKGYGAIFYFSLEDW